MAGRAEYDRELLGRLQPWLDTSVGTFIAIGTAATQVILAINNPALSNRIVTLRRLVVCFQHTAAVTRPLFLLKAPALATLGTDLRAAGQVVEDRTGQAVTTYGVLGPNAADLGALTPITPGAGGIRMVRFSPQTAIAGFTIALLDGIDQSIEPGESFHLATDLAATDNTTVTAWITEHLGLG